MSNRTNWLLGPLLLAAFPAAGQERDADEKIGWSFELKAGYETEPAYTGSDVSVSEFLVDARAEYQSAAGPLYFLSLGEVGVQFEAFEDTFVRGLIEYEFGRDNADDPILAGFPVVEDTVEVQLGIGRQVGPFLLGGAVQVDALGRGKGVVGFVGASYGFQLSDRLTGAASLDISFANAEHMNTEVGISSTTSAATGLAAYTASGGYKGATLGLELEYALSERLALFGDLSYEIYGANMTDSPLIRDEGRDKTYEASVGLALRF